MLQIYSSFQYVPNYTNYKQVANYLLYTEQLIHQNQQTLFYDYTLFNNFIPIIVPAFQFQIQILLLFIIQQNKNKLKQSKLLSTLIILNELFKFNSNDNYFLPFLIITDFKCKIFLIFQIEILQKIQKFLF
ncbi:unnamed protein product [Paramecium sonneborni]|uniref:Transmembrane protein n=1 Tax=Paramecium sonneborni TaxID=65129 RepID=A0A8S1QRV1_9CILI|nr:unnamed protein product [Paramecium sonneborni]